MVNTASAPNPFAIHWSLYPRHYVAPYTAKPLVIDGNIDKPEWSNVPWSAPFDDIRGVEDAPPSDRPSVSCRTRMKMLWDENFLYVCALIESDFTVVANFTKRNEPIYHTDSDFEVFVNPSSSCHNYKELELNAINTVWNLMLDKPYSDGGSEHSGRIAQPGDKQYYEVYSQQSATKVREGKIGDPHGAKWSVEIALAHSDTLASDPRGKVPQLGQTWRINFSRVENKGDTNWTWQPQRIWDPAKGRMEGKVAMHLPDSWGYVEFGDRLGLMKDTKKTRDVVTEKEEETARIHHDVTWPAKLAVMNIYYAQRQFATLNDGKYAPTIEALKDFTDHKIMDPFLGKSSSSSNGSAAGADNSNVRIRLLDGGVRYVATVTIPPNDVDSTDTARTVVSVTDDRLLTIENPSVLVNQKEDGTS